MQKSVYLYERINDREKFYEKSLPEMEDFYNHLIIDDITDTDYTHSKRVCNNFEIKKVGEYHNFYVQIHTLLSANVYQDFNNM